MLFTNYIKCVESWSKRVSLCLSQPRMCKLYVNFTIYIICTCSHGHSHQNCTQLTKALQPQYPTLFWIILKVAKKKGLTQFIHWEWQPLLLPCCALSSATKTAEFSNFRSDNEILLFMRAAGHRSASLHGLILNIKLFALTICDEENIWLLAQFKGLFAFKFSWIVKKEKSELWSSEQCWPDRFSDLHLCGSSLFHH